MIMMILGYESDLTELVEAGSFCSRIYGSIKVTRSVKITGAKSSIC